MTLQSTPEVGLDTSPTARPVRRALDRGMVLVGEILITAGVILGLFVVWQLFYTDVQSGRTQAAALDELTFPETPRVAASTGTGETAEPDALDSHIGDTIAEALAQDDRSDEPEAHAAVTVSTLDPTPSTEGQADTADFSADDEFDTSGSDSSESEESEESETDESATPAVALADDDDDIFVKSDTTLESIDHDTPGEPRDSHRWDESRLVASGGALHHEDLTATPLDDPRPDDPNAAWLADLYSQFIDEPETAGNTKKRRRGEPNPVDVAFKSSEQDGEAKVSTLKRLMSALKKL